MKIEEPVALITDRKGSLCFQKRLSVILTMGDGLHPQGQSASREGGVHPGGLPTGGSASSGSAHPSPN